MNDFEQVLVMSFNSFFEKSGIKGISHRIKQHRFSYQFVDVLVDSLHPDYYLGIECKSISVEKGVNALYFTQHFTTDKNGDHQIDRVANFLKKSGRKGFLLVELRRGSGNKKNAYAISWNQLEILFNSEDRKGITVSELQAFPKLERIGNYYKVDPVQWEYI